MSDAMILDANAIIALLDGNKAIAQMLETAKQVFVPAIVCGEIDVGTQGCTKRELAARTAFASLLEVEQVAVLPIMRTTAEYYARVFSFLKSIGTPIPTNDLWIAASVLETGGVLITADKHLLSIPLIRTKSF